MNKKSLARIGAFVFGASLAAWLSAGCDPTASSDTTIKVEPQTTELLGEGASVVLTAAGVGTNDMLYLPLVWSVTRPDLGAIVSSAGRTAVYESNGRVGHNTVIVRDQGEFEGLASIQQIELVETNGMAATP